MTDARFTRGSTMRHVAVMTTTSAIGLMALFAVDAANLFYISLLGQTELAAAIGFAGTLQFFLISVSIGLAIAATATVSRAIGAGETARARRLAASSAVTLVAVLSLVSLAVWIWRDAALGALGATGEAREIAGRFLAIVLPGMPFLGIGMVAGGLLRALGDARRAMYVTLGGGALAVVLDPLFIFGFGLGVEGAAIVSVITRVAVAAIGLRFAVGHHDMIARPSLSATLSDAAGFLRIAAPAVATQVSTPFGMAYLTGVVAQHGDEAVAGWAVVGRLTALAFGGIFALSGAVGPIFGQNLGAGRTDRIRATLRDALLFAAGYVTVVWTVLILLGPLIADGFGLAGRGREVFLVFTQLGAGAYLFTAALFVSNAAFNNLGKPTWSTGLNWTRDAAVIPILAFLLAPLIGAAGAVVVQAAAGIFVGTGAAILAWRYVAALDDGPSGPVEPAATAPEPPFSSGRSALAAQPVQPAPPAQPVQPAPEARADVPPGRLAERGETG
ncbi:MAG: MATE family efflux transporter [Paracoccaceae bacterium]